MKPSDWCKSRIFPVFVLVLSLPLLLVVACGAAATPVVVEKEVVKEVPKEVVVATPTFAAAPGIVPREPTGTVILVQSDWGNELFTDRDVRGEGSVYQKYPHDFFIWGKEGRELVPGLAESWSFSPDGLTWTFRVREGIKFQNGTALTAEDVAYSLDQEFGKGAIEKAVDPSIRNTARDIREPFTATEPFTVSVTTAKPMMFLPFSLSEMAPGPFGTVFSKAYRERVGRAGYNDNPSPGTTGPFTLIKHDKGSLMRFERWDDYWAIDQRNHQFEILDLRLIPELSTRVAALRTGEVDIIEANLEVRDQIESAGGKIIWGPEALYLWVLSEGCWPEADPVIPCYKKGIRQALDYAINKEMIAREIYGEEMAERRGWAHVSPSALGYERDLDSWPFDPAKAKALLAEAGCPNADCFPDPYKIFTWEAGELPFVPDVAQIVCDMWEENLGVKNCEVEIGDSVSIKDKMHSFQIAGNYVIRPNEDRFDGGSITFSHYAGQEPTVLRVPELADLTNKALGLIGTMEERHEAYHDMYVLARELHGEWSLFSTNTPWAVGPKIKDWKPWAMVPNVTATWTIELAK